MKAEKHPDGTGIRKSKASDTGRDDEPGRPVTLTCPECGGPVSAIAEKSGLRFRCQVGHGFTLHAILFARLQDTERSLWHLASNSLEAANLSELLGRQFLEGGVPTLARKYRRLGRFFRGQFAACRKMVLELPDGTFGEEAGLRRMGK